MDATTLLTRLEEAAVVAPVGASGDLALTDEFQSAVADRRAAHHGEDAASFAETVATLVDDAGTARVLHDPETDDRECAYVYMVLSAVLSDLEEETRVQLAALVNANFGDPPRDEGAPRSFLPVHGEKLPPLANAHRRAIVYVWRDDCEPCDIMREHFDDILPTAPDDIALYAVYGPSAVDVLFDEYGVVGAPTTLFMLDGRVDCRLTKAQYPSVIETEIRKLRELG